MTATQHREATKGGKRHGQIRRCKKTGEEKTTENSQREEAGKAGKEKEQIANQRNKRLINNFAFYDDLGRNRMIGTPARPSKALTVKAMEIPNRSESQPTNTTTAAELRNEIIIYNPLAAPRFLPQ